MKFNCLIRRDTLKNWADYNPVLKDKELVAVYDGDQLYGYKIGDGRSSWDELNYTNLADLGEFRIYVGQNGTIVKEDTIVMVNLNPGLLAEHEKEDNYFASYIIPDEPIIPVKIKVMSYDKINRNGTVLKK